MCMCMRVCRFRIVCVGCMWVYRVYALCVCYAGVGVCALYMHFVSVGVLVAGFGCEGCCGGFENKNKWQLNMIVWQGKLGQGGLSIKFINGCWELR